jgi:hypothetical protein
MTARPPQLDLAAVLPPRPITVRPPAAVGPMGMLGMFLVLFGALCAALFGLGSDIVGDWRARGDVVAAGDARIDESRCRSWLAVFVFCSVKTVDPGGLDGGNRTFWYVFADAAPEQSIMLQRSSADRSLLTTDLGQDQFYNRVTMLALILALLSFCIAAAASLVWKGKKALWAFAAMSGQQLAPIVVAIERNNLIPPRRRLWVYLYDDAGKQGRAFVELPRASGRCSPPGTSAGR